MNSLAPLVQEALRRDPHGGHLYVFRGKSCKLIKILWHDGLGMSLYAKCAVAVRQVAGRATEPRAQVDDLGARADLHACRQCIIGQFCKPSQDQLKNFLSANGFNAAAGFFGGISQSYTPGSGFATGAGFVSPQLGVSYNYSFFYKNIGFRW